jgi:hypothetical protein
MYAHAQGEKTLHRFLSRVIKDASTDVGEMYHAPILHVNPCVCMCLCGRAGGGRRACLPVCTPIARSDEREDDDDKEP